MPAKRKSLSNSRSKRLSSTDKHLKKLVLPVAGGGLTWLITGVVSLAVLVFLAIFAGHWLMTKKR
jgi:hypothetical protein